MKDSNIEKENGDKKTGRSIGETGREMRGSGKRERGERRKNRKKRTIGQD